MTSTRSDSLFKSHFTFWFFAYLSLYLAGLVGLIPLLVVKFSFYVLHIFAFLYVLRHLVRNRPTLEGLIFYALLIWILLWPGVYLEFPSDPWEHLRRMLRWGAVANIRDHEQSLKFIYYWNWTFLSEISFENRRLALDLISAFWQFAWVCAIVRFARALGESIRWSLLHGTAFFILFGTNIFGLRYYALSSMPIAAICYFESLIVLVNRFKNASRPLLKFEKNEIVFLLMAISVIVFNHMQELLLLLLSASALVYLDWIKRIPLAKFARVKKKILVFVGLGFVSGFGLKYGFQPLYTLAGDYQFLPEGSLKIFHNGYRYQDTLGIHGMIGVVFSVWLYRRYPIPSLLTLAPLFALIFPPVTLIYIKALMFTDEQGAGSIYRLLYAMPTSIMLIIGLRELLAKLSSFKKLTLPLKNPALQWSLVCALILALSWPQKKNWRGRLYFQTYRSPPVHNLVPQDQTVVWFKENRPGCFPVTDPLTGMALEAQLGFPARADRLRKIGEVTAALTPDYFVAQSKVADSCGYLVADLNKVPGNDGSNIAWWSGHWDVDVTKLTLITPPGLLKLVAQLQQEGWQTTVVPPFYLLVEPSLK